MYVILVYDVKQKRVSKVMKICRKYLVHVQRSVFEGQLTDAKLCSLKKEIKQVVSPQEDAICIYQMENMKYARKEHLGIREVFSSII